MLTSGRTEPGSVAAATALIGPSAEPIPRPGRADLPCRSHPDMWFAERPIELELAKAFCIDCPARVACLAGALRRRERWGIWGGEIFDRGKIVATKRLPGRPRKTALPREQSSATRSARAQGEAVLAVRLRILP